MTERRSEPRYLCADLVKVVVYDTVRPSTTLVANLEDISPSGACIQLERALCVGADVDLVCSKCRMRGKVRHCRFVNIGYDVGVEFLAQEGWDRSKFEPDHLLEIPMKKSSTSAPPR